jgi:predicted ester cyclase
VTPHPQLPLGVVALRKAQVHDDERGARRQSPVHLRRGPAPLLRREEVQRQQAGRRRERARRHIIDVPLMHPDARGVRPEGLRRQLEHGGRRIDGVERPPRMSLRERLRLRTAACPEHQDPGIGRRAFVDEDGGHPVDVPVGGHHLGGAISVGVDVQRVVEGIGRRGHGPRLSPRMATTPSLCRTGNMMSVASDSDLRDTYRDYLACLNERRWDDLGQFVADDVAYNGEPVGLTGYRSMLEADTRAIPDLRFVPEILLADDDVVSCRLAFECCPEQQFLGFAPTGARITFAEHVFYRFADGRIVEVWSLIDKEAIRVQLSR